MKQNRHRPTTPIREAPPTPSPRISASDTRFWHWLCLGIVALFCAILFREALLDWDTTLWFADGNVVQHRAIVDAIRDFGGIGFQRGNWLGTYLETGQFFYPNWPLLLLMPLGQSMWLNIALHILVAAAGAFYCARVMGVSARGAAIAGVAFGLNGHFLSLMGAGHLGKLQCIPWIPWVFGFFWKGWENGRFLPFLLASICYSAMWQSGEQPLAYFVALFLGLFTIVRTAAAFISRDSAGLSPRKASARAALSAAFILMTIPLGWQSFHGSLAFLREFRPVTAAQPTTATSEIDPEEAAAQRKSDYEFAVSWSFPPEETLAFFMSGRFFGGASPVYWGRTGSSDMKLKQVDDYMGVLVVVLALLALPLWRQSVAVRFLALVSALSLLIGFGGYTPFYRLIHALPVFGALRVPARWIALTAFGLCLLAGFGHDRFVGLAPGSQKPKISRCPIVLGAIGGVFLLVAALLRAMRAGLAASWFFDTPPPVAGPELDMAAQLAEARMGSLIDAFLWTGVFALLSAGILALGRWNRALDDGTAPRSSRATLWTLCATLLIGADLSLNNAAYISFFDWTRYYEADGLIEGLKRDKTEYGVVVLGAHAHPYLNRFASYTAPWHRIEQTMPTVVHRKEAALAPIIEALFGNEPYDSIFRDLRHYLNTRFYDYFGIKYILSAFQFPPEALQYAQLREVHRFEIPGTPPFWLYRYIEFKSAPYLVRNAVFLPSEEDVLAKLADPSFDTRTTVALVGTEEIAMPAANGDDQVSVIEFSPRRIRVQATIESQAWLVFRMRYSPAWSVTINGKPARLRQANSMQSAVALEQGVNSIELTLPSVPWHLIVVMTSWLVALSLAAVLHVWQRREQT